jgi:hypothetical protein
VAGYDWLGGGTVSELPEAIKLRIRGRPAGGEGSYFARLFKFSSIARHLHVFSFAIDLPELKEPSGKLGLDVREGTFCQTNHISFHQL